MIIKKFEKKNVSGVSSLTYGLWYFFGSRVFKSHLLCFSGLKILTLKIFGAQIGFGCNIKPGILVKFPWKLKIGNHVWLGEGVWIDNIETVEIGNDVCVSQGVYFCTGNHDWSREDFALTAKPIKIENQVWLGARSVVGPGVTVKEGAVLGLGSVATKDLESWIIYIGNPAVPVKNRRKTAS